MQPRSRNPALSRASTNPLLIRSAIIAVFSGLSLGTNYTLFGLSNIKFMDTFNFTATYLFGISVGLPTVILTRTIYAVVNPLGPATGWLIVTLVLGDCFYALAGVLARRTHILETQRGTVERSVLLGIVGFSSALGFDLLTNFQSGLIAVSAPNLPAYLTKAFYYGLATMNFPVPMGVLHEASDFLFFSTVAPAAIALLKRSTLLEQGPIGDLVRLRKLEKG